MTWKEAGSLAGWAFTVVWILWMSRLIIGLLRRFMAKRDEEETAASARLQARHEREMKVLEQQLNYWTSAANEQEVERLRKRKRHLELVHDEEQN